LFTDPEIVAFAAQRGYDLAAKAPRALAEMRAWHASLDAFMAQSECEVVAWKPPVDDVTSADLEAIALTASDLPGFTSTPARKLDGMPGNFHSLWARAEYAQSWTNQQGQRLDEHLIASPSLPAAHARYQPYATYAPGAPGFQNFGSAGIGDEDIGVSVPSLSNWVFRRGTVVVQLTAIAPGQQPFTADQLAKWAQMIDARITAMNAPT
jgi:hypothetical protein